MSNLYRGPSIDASYQASVHLAEGFQRRRLKCEKLTDDRRLMPSDGKSSHCLWQGEQKQQTVDYIMKYHIFHHKMSQIDSLYINENSIYYLERGCDRMVVGFTTTYAIGAYHH